MHACMCTRVCACVLYEYPMLVPQSSDVQKTNGSGLPSLWSLLTYININWRCWGWTRPRKLMAPLQKDCCRYRLWTHQRLSLHTLDSPAAVPTHSGLTSGCPYTLWTHQRLSLHTLSLHTLDSPAAVATCSGLTSRCRYTLWTHQPLSLHTLGSPTINKPGAAGCIHLETDCGSTRQHNWEITATVGEQAISLVTGAEFDLTVNSLQQTTV